MRSVHRVLTVIAWLALAGSAAAQSQITTGVIDGDRRRFERRRAAGRRRRDPQRRHQSHAQPDNRSGRTVRRAPAAAGPLHRHAEADAGSPPSCRKTCS